MGKASWDARVTGLGPRDVPTVGVLPALSEAFEDKEEELSARASGAAGGGLALEVLGGLNGRTISLIPVSFPVGSLGLEEGRGGGTRAPAVSGVVGRFGTGTVVDDTEEEEPAARVGLNGSRDRRSLLVSSYDVGTLGFASSSLDWFLRICPEVVGDRMMFPMEALSSSMVAWF